MYVYVCDNCKINILQQEAFSDSWILFLLKIIVFLYYNIYK